MKGIPNVQTIMAAIFAVAATPAIAQQRCGNAETMRAALVSKYGEVAVGAGLTASGRFVEMWGNKKSGSWTVTMTTAAGVMCLLADGQAFTVPGIAPSGLTL